MKTKIILLASVVLLSLAPVAAQAGFYGGGDYGFYVALSAEPFAKE